MQCVKTDRNGQSLFLIAFWFLDFLVNFLLFGVICIKTRNTTTAKFCAYRDIVT